MGERQRVLAAQPHLFSRKQLTARQSPEAKPMLGMMVKSDRVRVGGEHGEALTEARRWRSN